MALMWYAVDPGLSGLGIACFDKKKLQWWNTYYPKGIDFKKKADFAVWCLTQHVSSYSRVFCEWPSYQTLEAQNTFSICKLTFLIGSICNEFKNVTLIPVVKWKGQLKKEITQKRAEVFFQQKGFTSHAADAVALGKWVIENELF